jgi:hypothetical protein
MWSQPFIVTGKSQPGVYLAQKLGGGFFGQMPTDEPGVEIKYFACFKGEAEILGMREKAVFVTMDDGSVLGLNTKFARKSWWAMSIVFSRLASKIGRFSENHRNRFADNSCAGASGLFSLTFASCSMLF